MKSNYEADFYSLPTVNCTQRPGVYVPVVYNWLSERWSYTKDDPFHPTVERYPLMKSDSILFKRSQSRFLGYGPPEILIGSFPLYFLESFAAYRGSFVMRLVYL